MVLPLLRLDPFVLSRRVFANVRTFAAAVSGRLILCRTVLLATRIASLCGHKLIKMLAAAWRPS